MAVCQKGGAFPMRIQLRDDLLDWEPGSPTKSPENNALSPERNRHRPPAYAHAAPDIVRGRGHKRRSSSSRVVSDASSSNTDSPMGGTVGGDGGVSGRVCGAPPPKNDATNSSVSNSVRSSRWGGGKPPWAVSYSMPSYSSSSSLSSPSSGRSAAFADNNKGNKSSALKGGADINRNSSRNDQTNTSLLNDTSVSGDSTSVSYSLSSSSNVPTLGPLPSQLPPAAGADTGQGTCKKPRDSFAHSVGGKLSTPTADPINYPGRLRRNPSILKPERRYHAPPSDLLDMDVTQLLTSSIRMVREVGPMTTSSSFGGASTTSSFTKGGADGVFPFPGKFYDEETLNAILGSSVEIPAVVGWEPPRRRGSLLDWSAEDHLEHSPRLSPFRFCQTAPSSRNTPADGSALGVDNRGQLCLDESNAGTITFKETARTSASVDFRFSYRASSASSSSSSSSSSCTAPTAAVAVAVVGSYPHCNEMYDPEEPETPLTTPSTMTSSSIGGSTGVGGMGASFDHLQGCDWMAALKRTTGMLRVAPTEADQSWLQTAKNLKPLYASSVSTGGSLPMLLSIGLASKAVAPPAYHDNEDDAEEEHNENNDNLAGINYLHPVIPQWKRTLIATRRKQIALKASCRELPTIRREKMKKEEEGKGKADSKDGNTATMTQDSAMAVANEQNSQGYLNFSPSKDTDDRGGLHGALAADAPDGWWHAHRTRDKCPRLRAVSSMQANVRRRQVQRAVLAQLSEDMVTGGGDDDEDNATTKAFGLPRVYRGADSPSTYVGSVSVKSILRDSAIVGARDNNDGENADDFEKMASETHAMIEQLSGDSPSKGIEAQQILLRLLEEERQEEDSAKVRKGKALSVSHAEIIRSLSGDDTNRNVMKRNTQTDDSAKDGDRNKDGGDKSDAVLFNKEAETAHLEWKLAMSQHTPGPGFLTQLHRIATAKPAAYKMPESRIWGVTKFQAIVRKVIARRDLLDALLFHFAQVHQQKQQQSGEDEGDAAAARLVLESAYSKQDQLQHQREQQMLSTTEAATVLQCMYRKATAERAVLDRLLDHIGDADFSSGGGGGGRAVSDDNSNKRSEKSQCIILEGKRWSALVLGRATSPLPEVDPEMTTRLAEQYRLYEHHQQLALKSAAGAYGSDDGGGESTAVGNDTPGGSQAELKAIAAAASKAAQYKETEARAAAAVARRRESERAAAEERGQLSADRTAWLKAQIEKARQNEAEALDAGRPPLPPLPRTSPPCTKEEVKDEAHRRAVLAATMTRGGSANHRQVSRAKQEQTQQKQEEDHQEKKKTERHEDNSGKAAVLVAVAMLERGSSGGGGGRSEHGAAGRVSYTSEKPLSSVMVALLKADGDLHRQAAHAVAISAGDDKGGSDPSPSLSDDASMDVTCASLSELGTPLSPPSSSSAAVRWNSSSGGSMKRATSQRRRTPSPRRNDRNMLSPDGSMRSMRTSQDEAYSVTLSLENLDDATEDIDGVTPTSSLEFVDAIAEQKQRQLQLQQQQQLEDQEGEVDEDNRSDDPLVVFSSDDDRYPDEALSGTRRQENDLRGKSAEGHGKSVLVEAFLGDDRDVLDDTDEDMDLVEYDDENDAKQHNAFVEFTELRSDRNDTNASFVSDTARPDSVASLAIPEDEELLPPMSPYELSRRQGLAEPLAHEKSVDGSEEYVQRDGMSPMGDLIDGGERVGNDGSVVDGEEGGPERGTGRTDDAFDDGDGEETRVGDQENDGAEGEFYDDEAALKMEEEREALMLQGPMEVGSFAKALFDDEEHWYPCVVVARSEEQREEVLEFDEPDLVDEENGEVIEQGQLKKGDVQLVVSYFYALEYFDGDVREDVPEDDAVVMLPHEAIAHAQALLDKAEAEKIPHFDDNPEAWSDALRAAAEVMAEVEAMEAEAEEEALEAESAMAEDEEAETAAEASYSTAFQDMSSCALQEAELMDMAKDTATDARTTEAEGGDTEERKLANSSMGVTISSNLTTSTASSSFSLSSPSVPLNVQSQNASVMSGEAKVEATTAATAAEGWVTITTGATTYYWHEATGGVTYERPEPEERAATAELAEKRENAVREARTMSCKRSAKASLLNSPSSLWSSAKATRAPPGSLIDEAEKLRSKLDAPEANHLENVSSGGGERRNHDIITGIPSKQPIYSPAVSSSPSYNVLLGGAGLTKNALPEKALNFQEEQHAKEVGIARQAAKAAGAKGGYAEEQLRRDQAAAAAEERQKKAAAEKGHLQERITKAKRDDAEEDQKQVAEAAAVATAAASDAASSKNGALSQKTLEEQQITEAVKAAQKCIQDKLRAGREHAKQKEAQAKEEEEEEEEERRESADAADAIAATIAAAAFAIAEEKRSRTKDEATRHRVSLLARLDQELDEGIKPGSKAGAREEEEAGSQQGSISSVGADFKESDGDIESARCRANAVYAPTDEAEADRPSKQATRIFQKDDTDDTNNGIMEDDTAEISAGTAALGEAEAMNSEEEEGATEPQQHPSATSATSTSSLSANEAELAAAAATVRGDTNANPSLSPHTPLPDHFNETVTTEGSQACRIGGGEPMTATVTAPLSTQRMCDLSDPVALAMASYRRLATRSPFSSANSVTPRNRRSTDSIDDNGQGQRTTTARNMCYEALSASTLSNSIVHGQPQQQLQPPLSASSLWSSSDELPRGWQAVKAEEGGCYYWHVETNSVTWDHPVTGQRTLSSHRPSGSSSSSRRSSKTTRKSSSSSRRGSKEAPLADGISGAGANAGSNGSEGNSSERPSASMSSERHNSMSNDRQLHHTSPENDDQHHEQLVALQRRLQERRCGVDDEDGDASNDNTAGVAKNVAPPATHGDDFGQQRCEADYNGEKDNQVSRRFTEDIKYSSIVLTDPSSSPSSSAPQPVAPRDTVPPFVATSLSSPMYVVSVAAEMDHDNNNTELSRIQEHTDQQENGDLAESEVDMLPTDVANSGPASTADDNEYYGYYDCDGSDDNGAEYDDDGIVIDDRTGEEVVEGDIRRRQHEEKLLELLAEQGPGGGGQEGRSGAEQEVNDGSDGLHQAGAYYDHEYDDDEGLLEGEEFSGEDSVVLSTVEEGDEDFSMASHTGDDTPQQSEYGGCWGDDDDDAIATTQQQQHEQQLQEPEGQELGGEGAESEIGIGEKEEDVEFQARRVTPEFNEGDWDGGGEYYDEEDVDEDNFGADYADEHAQDVYAAAAEDADDHKDREEGDGSTQEGDYEYYRSERPQEDYDMENRHTPLSEAEQQENMDQMVDFLEHAGLGRFIEVFSHFGFGSVDDLLDPKLVMDDDLIQYCGMTEAEVAHFRGVVDAVNGIDCVVGSVEA